MKPLNHIIICVVLSVVSLHSYGQSRGYLGKPFLINYELGLIPNFSEPNGSGKILADNSRFSSAMNHKFSFDYQVGRSRLIGAGIGYSRTGYDFRGVTFTMPGSRERNSISPKPFNRLNVLSFDLRYTTFFSEVAPIGPFATFKAGINRIYFADENTLLSRGNNIDYTQEVATKQFYLGLQLGKQRVILDRFLLKYGVEFHVTANTPKILDRTFFPSGQSSDWFYHIEITRHSEFLKRTKSDMRKRVGKQTAIMFTVSLGVLAP